MLNKQRYKRIADGLEKLGIAGIALGIFQGYWPGFFQGIILFAISVALTGED